MSCGSDSISPSDFVLMHQHASSIPTSYPVKRLVPGAMIIPSYGTLMNPYSRRSMLLWASCAFSGAYNGQDSPFSAMIVLQLHLARHDIA